MKNSATQLNKDLEGFTPGEWKVVAFPDVTAPYYIESSERIKEIALILEVPHKDGKHIHVGEAKANAERIVKAVNNFDSLVAALQDIQAYIEESKNNFDEIGEDYPLDYGYLLSEINSALTKVK